MARKKPLVDPEVARVNAMASIQEATDQDRSVIPVKLDGSRELATIPPESLIWAPENNFKWKPGAGAIVRLRPPADASDADVERASEYFRKAGAERVTVLPRPRAEVIPAEAHERSPEKALGARDAVLSLVAESNSKDKEALAKLCERVMAEVGL